jgi:hypothetical protein
MLSLVQQNHQCLPAELNKMRMSKKLLLLIFISGTFYQRSFSQTDIDGLMMQKNFFCVGPTAGYSVWKNYWEGTLKRENLNLGKVSTTNFMVMGNYGISSKLNFLFGVPYVKTKASAGNMAGQKGFQDLSLFLKWVAYQKHIGKGDFKAILMAGASLPLSNYTADFLPLSIGLHSKMGIGRMMLDYQRNNWFGTGSFSFFARGNVIIDRYTYYTTEMHYTNEVKMPNASQLNFRAGYRSEDWVIEAVFNRWETLGGFDMPRNGMPFVSNEMDASTIGLNVKYETPLNGLSIVANGSTTVGGRNVGQATGFNAGFFYIMDFAK